MIDSYLTYTGSTVYFAPAAPLYTDPYADWLRFLARRMRPERPVDRARRLHVERAMRARARHADRRRRQTARRAAA